MPNSTLEIRGDKKKRTVERLTCSRPSVRGRVEVPEDGLEDVPGPVLDRSLVHEQRVAILRQNKLEYIM